MSKILAIEGKKYRCKNGEIATVLFANFGLFGRSTMVCSISDGQRITYDLDGTVDSINFHEYDLVEELEPNCVKEQPKKYRFDYIEDAVKEWKCDHITKSMLDGLPFGILFYEGGRDFYGEPIENFNSWLEQRKSYVEEYLYPKYKR